MDFKKDFPLFQTDKSIYLDNAATAQRPQCVIDAEADFYMHHNANPLRGFYPLSLEATDMYEAARETVRKFINAKSTEEIIFTRNTTESINLAAYSYGMFNVTKGDRIVVTIMEHHSNQLPWRMVAERTGAELYYLYCEADGTLTDDAINEAITPNTRILAFAQVSNVLGCVNPVEKLVKKAHEAGAVVLVDAAQSAPHMKIDVQAMDVDFLAFSGHKLMGPMGIGVLYGKKKLLNKMEPFMTGGEMISSVTLEKVTYAELPHKFEAGTVNAAGAVGLKAAIEYIESIGFDVMQEQEEKLVKRAMDGIKNIPHVHVLGSEDYRNHTGIVSFVIDGVHPHDISSIMEADGLDIRSGHHCAQPLLKHLGVNSSARASFMFYNTEEEVDAFLESLRNIRRRMGYDGL